LKEIALEVVIGFRDGPGNSDSRISGGFAEPQAGKKSPGIGPIIASALIASIEDAKNFANGWQLA
jgi:hypothetical protein